MRTLHTAAIIILHSWFNIRTIVFCGTKILFPDILSLHLTIEVIDMPYQIKRIYDGLSDNDGYRVLVDRVWPRGVSKERAHLDAWLK